MGSAFSGRGTQCCHGGEVIEVSGEISPDTEEPEVVSEPFAEPTAQSEPRELRLLGDVCSNPPRNESNAGLSSDAQCSGASVGTRLKKSRKVVHLEMTVLGVFKLDTIEQIFGVHLGVIMQWRCPDDEVPPLPSEDDGDWEPNWTPKYTITAEVQELSAEIMYSVVFADDGARWIRMEASHLVDIYEELELHSFPNDVQDLTIELRSKSTIERVVWVPPSGKADFARISKGTCYLHDFEILKALPYTFSLVPQEKMEGGHKVSCAAMTLKTKRKSRYYILNCNLFVFLTCTFELLTWAIHPADIAGRQDTDFMIILTMVSLFAGKSLMMPPLSYVTTLDIYMFLNLACVILVTLSHLVVPLAVLGLADMSPLSKAPLVFDDEQRLIDADMWSFWGFLIFMVVYNVGYTAYVCHRNARESSLFLQRSREQQDHDIGAARDFLAGAGLTDLPEMPRLDAAAQASHVSESQQQAPPEQ